MNGYDYRVVTFGPEVRRDLGAPPPIFTPDMPAAYASIRKLAGMDINVLGMGHGDAVTQNAVEQLRALAATLPA